MNSHINVSSHVQARLRVVGAGRQRAAAHARAAKSCLASCAGPRLHSDQQQIQQQGPGCAGSAACGLACGWLGRGGSVPQRCALASAAASFLASRCMSRSWAEGMEGGGGWGYGSATISTEARLKLRARACVCMGKCV